MALALLAVGVLLLTPLVAHAGTSLTDSETCREEVLEYGTADAGVEHAMWRLKYEEGFAQALTDGGPTADYAVSVNSTDVPISICMELTEPPPPPPPPVPTWWFGVAVGQEVEPGYTDPGVPTTFTYTLTVGNEAWLIVYELEEIGVLLPEGFEYVAGSSSGVTGDDPTIGTLEGQPELTWTFSEPLPELLPGEVVTQTFQATATLDEGETAWSWAWVEATGLLFGFIPIDLEAFLEWLGIEPPEPEPCGITGSWKIYQIGSSDGDTSIQAEVMIDEEGEIIILSWQVN